MEYKNTNIILANDTANKTDYSLIDKEIGNRLKNRRLTLGISQMELADVLGITFQQVQKYEKGKNRINSSRLFHISDVLDIPISYFFTDIENITDKKRKRQQLPPPSNASYNRADIQLLIEYYDKIDNKEIKEGLLTLAKSMAEEYGKAYTSNNASNDNQ